MRTKKFLPCLLAVFLLIFNFSSYKNLSAAGVGSTIAETIPDPNLAAVVAAALKANVNDVITEKNVADLTVLSGSASNEISNLTGLSTFKNLFNLNISYNKLTDLEAIIQELSGMDNLQILNLNSNLLLGGIPESIGKLSHLKMLNVSGNASLGGSVPESIGQLKNLTHLNLTNTGITSLSESIIELTNLETLYAYNNGLVSLPNQIVQLDKLTTFNVAHNQISVLSKEQYEFIAKINTHDLSSQKSEQSAETVAVIGQNYTVPTFPIYAQSTDYLAAEDQCTLHLKKPSGEWSQLIKPQVPADGTLTLPAEAITEVGEYELQFRFPNTATSELSESLYKTTFTARAPEKYTLTFNSMGGTAVDSQEVVEGQAPKAVPNPTKDGFKFKAWFLDEAGSKPFDFSSALNGDLTVYALWEAASTPTPATPTPTPATPTPSPATPTPAPEAPTPTPATPGSTLIPAITTSTTTAAPAATTSALPRTGEKEGRSAILAAITLSLAGLLIIVKRLSSGSKKPDKL